jgi:hypothetical protein
MAIVTLTSSEPESIKRFYIDKSVSFQKKCDTCGQMLVSHNDMFEYPAEDINVYFHCEDCKKYMTVELRCLGGDTRFYFDVPDEIMYERPETED